MRNVRAVLLGAVSLAVLAGFVAGVPVGLALLVGNPFPSSVPSWSSVMAIVESGSLPSDVLMRVLAVIVWIWWSQLALSFVVEIAAACRGRTARPLPLRGLGMQSLVMRLVALVVTAAGLIGSFVHPAVAAPPSFADVVISTSGAGTPHRPASGVLVVPSPNNGVRVTPEPAAAPPADVQVAPEPAAASPAAASPGATPAFPAAPVLAPPQQSGASSWFDDPYSAETAAPVLFPPVDSMPTAAEGAMSLLPQEPSTGSVVGSTVGAPVPVGPAESFALPIPESIPAVAADVALRGAAGVLGSGVPSGASVPGGSAESFALPIPDSIPAAAGVVAAPPGGLAGSVVPALRDEAAAPGRVPDSVALPVPDSIPAPDAVPVGESVFAQIVVSLPVPDSVPVPAATAALPVPAAVPAGVVAGGETATAAAAIEDSTPARRAASMNPFRRDAKAGRVVAGPDWVVVRPGDSLWHLAEAHLGDPLRWTEIFQLNHGPLPGGGTLRDPDLIHPGWRLRLPAHDGQPSPAPPESADASAVVESAEAPAQLESAEAPGCAGPDEAATPSGASD